jgi:hypothetical protein
MNDKTASLFTMPWLMSPSNEQRLAAFRKRAGCSRTIPLRSQPVRVIERGRVASIHRQMLRARVHLAADPAHMSPYFQCRRQPPLAPVGTAPGWSVRRSNAAPERTPTAPMQRESSTSTHCGDVPEDAVRSPSPMSTSRETRLPETARIAASSPMPNMENTG